MTSQRSIDRFTSLFLTLNGRGAAHAVTMPATGALLGEYLMSTAADVEKAALAGRAAQREWARVALADRARVLSTFHDLVLDHSDDLLDVIQAETGKARGHAFDEVLDTAVNARHYANTATRTLAPRRHPGAFPLLTSAIEVRHPKGLIGIISPWNYPVSLAVAEALPALVAGNAVLHMPDRQTALCLLLGRQLCERAGLPKGLWQVVVGPPEQIGPALIDQVDHIMFTGSTATGRKVAEQAARRLISSTLELGGKNPMIVCEDADLARAADGAVAACFSSTGQLCMSIERIYLHRSIAEEFTRRFVRATKALRIGASFDHRFNLGSLTSAAQLQRVQNHVDDAVAKGATVLTGGQARPDLGPLFFEPTILTDLPPDALCATEETFGPVVSITVVNDDEAAIAAANASEFGLNASIWAAPGRGHKIARRLRSGMVNINEGFSAAWGSTSLPVGGVGQSGTGRRHGQAGLLDTTSSQAIARQDLLSIGESGPLQGRTRQIVMTAGLRALKFIRRRS